MKREGEKKELEKGEREREREHACVNSSSIKHIQFIFTRFLSRLSGISYCTSYVCNLLILGIYTQTWRE